jgi:diaminopimelate epimerase
MRDLKQQRIHFFKMTGAGNDFILIDNRTGLVDADHCQDFVRQVCRHKLSAGADGVILIENDPELDFKWRFFNADASEAEMCGNGARCAARFVNLTGILTKPRMAFRTLAGVIHAELLGNRVKVQMTDPHSFRADIRLDADGRTLELDSINTGVPHAVSFQTDAEALESVNVERWGRSIRFDAHFKPAGTNANFVFVQDPHHLSVRTYERGVEGETLACGTGCIASCLVAAARNLALSPVEVKTRGGEILKVYFEISGKTGNPAETIFREVYLEGEARVAYEADLWTETLQ